MNYLFQRPQAVYGCSAKGCSEKFHKNHNSQKKTCAGFLILMLLKTSSNILK